MRFLADIGISPRTIEWLRQQDYDSVHLVDEGLNFLSYEAIVHKARTENRMILTIDLDFGYLLANLPSIVIFRLGNASRSVVQARLAEVLSLCSKACWCRKLLKPLWIKHSR